MHSFAALLVPFVLMAVPPANDGFANRLPLSAGAVNGTTLDATSEIGNGEPYPGSGDLKTVWYQLNIPAGQKARLTLTPGTAARDIRLAAYTGTDFNDMVREHLTTEPEGQADKFVYFNTGAGVLTMFIQIDSPNADAGAFQLATVFDTTGPANDNFSARTVLTAGTVNGTCTNATPEVGETPFSGEAQALSVWYEVTIPAGQNLRLNFANQTPGADFILPFFTGTDIATLTPVGILDPNLGESRAVNLRNTGASPLTYVFAVEPQLAFGTNGSFQIITSLDATNPANDNLADAIVLTSGNFVAGTNVNATTEPAEGFDSFATVWYSVTVPANQQALISVVPAAFDVNLTAFTGSTYADLSQFSTGQNAGAGGTEHLVLRNTLGGSRTYRIMVHGATSNASGTFDIRATISAIGPANDDILAKHDVNAGDTVNGTTVNATPESGEPAHAGIAAAKSVWYTVSINPGQQGVFTFTPTGFDLRAGIYDGEFFGVTPAAVASLNAAGNGGVETVTIPNYGGFPRSLWVAVDSMGGGSGAFTFQFQQQPAPLPNDNFADALTSSAASGNFNADTAEATAETGEPQIEGSAPKSLWYRLTAPQTGKLNLTVVTNSGDAAKCAVFSGSAVGSLTMLAGYSDQRKVLVTAGQVLHVAVATPTGQHGQASLSFAFSDTLPGEFSFNDTTATALEQNGGVTITLVRFNGADGAATVPFTLTPGSASSADYTGTSGQFVFADDENVAEVTIPIVNDTAAEPDESFTLTLGTPSTGALGTNTSVVITIEDPEDSAGGGGGGAFDFLLPSAGYSGLVNSTFAQPGFGTVQFYTGGDKTTGKLLFDGLTVPFKAAFVTTPTDGTLTANLFAKRGKTVLNLVLTLNMQGDGTRFTGTLTGAGPTPYVIAGERNALGSKLVPISLAGRYNALLDGNVGGDVRGIASINVKPTGGASVAGVLPDGTKFVTGGNVSLLGRLDFAKGLYKKEALKTTGYIAGTVQFDKAATPKTLAGTARWNKPTGNGKLYPAGVANTTMVVEGALYRPPLLNQRALADFDANNGAAVAGISEGNLGGPISKAVNIATTNSVAVTTPGADGLKVTINPALGAFGGSFIHTDGKPRKFSGLLVPLSPGRAEGLFIGTDRGGIIIIAP